MEFIEIMEPNRPEWRIPKNLQALIEDDEDLTWETDEWSPIQLTVMGGTSYCGRDIHQAWQIAFEPTGSTGYNWSARIEEAVKKQYPEMASELHFDDTELSTCVVWVESEATCRRLMEIIWALIQGD
jgi:hypothetical protein